MFLGIIQFCQRRIIFLLYFVFKKKFSYKILCTNQYGDYCVYLFFYFSKSFMLNRMNEWLKINQSLEKAKCTMTKILRMINMTLLSQMNQFCTINEHGDVPTCRGSICMYIISILIYCAKIHSSTSAKLCLYPQDFYQSIFDFFQ